MGCYGGNLGAMAIIAMGVAAAARPRGPEFDTRPGEPVERRGYARRLPSPEWTSTSPDSGVPAKLFVAAMTSLAPHYRDDSEALEAHLREEHAIHTAVETLTSVASVDATAGGTAAPASDAGIKKAYLCCTEYKDGPALKRSLEADAGGKRFVRTALNSAARGGFCAIAHISSAAAAARAADADDLMNVRCSPVTHASKEPLSLLAPASSSEPRPGRDGQGGGGDGTTGSSADGVSAADAAPFFGLRLGLGVQSGRSRGLVVTMSPGSLPLETSTGTVPDTAATAANTRGGGGGSREAERKLSSSSSVTSLSSPSKSLESAWRSFWGDARGSEGASVLTNVVPWTGGAAPVAGDGTGTGGMGRSSFLTDSSGVGASEGRKVAGSTSRAREFHGAKAAGYKAALEHLAEKMATENSGRAGGAPTLAETCGWDDNLVFVHGRDDLLYLRGIHHPEHSEATSEACFIGLVGFLSAQPEVLHIQPEARLEAGNKLLTAYIEGGEETETPMRSAGLTGLEQVIGVTDTGLDDNSCFFKDLDGSVPRTTLSASEFYPDQRKVIQYVAFADDTDSDGHGTHVAGIAAGKVFDSWQESWEASLPEEDCETAGLIRSCFGDCVEETVGGSCHWNPELSCPMSDCDDDTTCDDFTGYDFPCFEDPVDEIPEASGVASEAKLAFFDIGNADGSLLIPDDIGDMWDCQYAAGARVMSNSWSLVTMTEPSARDVQVDEWVHDHPDTLVVFGAGNNGFQDGSFNPSSVQSPATSKTVFTVGASNSGSGRAYAYYSDASSNYDGVLWPSEDEMFQVSPFSARGPVGDFTAKPDVVAPGLMVHSAKASTSDTSADTCALDSLGGTSMSAPAVAGAAAIVRQFFAEGVLAAHLSSAGYCGGTASDGGGVYATAGLCESFSPSGYLVKAVLVNSATWLGDMQTVSYDDKTQYMTVLDFAQGFGAVHLAASVPTDGTSAGAFYHDNELESEGVHYYSVYVSDPSEDLSVTLAWFDPPSSVSSYNLLHDLDVFVVSVGEPRLFRSNHYDTMLAMCEEEDDSESCAEKYDFSFDNNLADYMNPVERVSIASSELEEGNYVIGVRARVLTESDTQAYGLAAAGGGLVVNDMSATWEDLQSGGSVLGSEPDPDDPDSIADISSGTPAPAAGESSSLSPSSTPAGSEDAPSSSSTTNAPSSVSASEGTESAVASTVSPSDEPPTSAGGSGDDDDTGGSSSLQEHVDDAGNSTSGEDGSASQSSSSAAITDISGGDGGSSDGSGSGSGGQEDDNPGVETELAEGESSEEGSSTQSNVAIVASTVGAVLLIGASCCLAIRRIKLRSSALQRDETGSFLPNPGTMPSAVGAPPAKGASASVSVSPPPPLSSTFSFSEMTEAKHRGSQRHELDERERERDEVEEVSAFYADMPHLISRSGLRLGSELGMGSVAPDFKLEQGLPDYAAAVASDSEEMATCKSAREDPGVELASVGDDPDVSAFYASVNPGSVETLVSWGISRDFARVALRQTDNDVPEALRLIAEGNMDEMLAMDIEEMALDGKDAAAAAAAAEAKAEAEAAAVAAAAAGYSPA